MPLTWNDFAEGDALPTLEKAPGVTQLIVKLSCQYRGMDMPDKPMTLGGTVVRKWEEDGEKRAELELFVKDAEGKNTTPGSAIVSLKG